jgi:hypothetical protein
MDRQKEQPSQIQLELPDYSKAYYEYLQKKEQENKQEDTVIIIDIY